MNTVTAHLYNYRQSPRKVRLVANLVKGKNALDAITLLSFTVKEATNPLRKLILSALQNAKNNNNLDSANLVVKSFEVNAGPVMKRSMPRARGSAYPIKKRTCHISLVLEEKISIKSETKHTKIKTLNPKP